MSSESGSIMGGGMVGGAIGASIGALIGAAIWATIGYTTGYEVGWIAWGLGALVGLGMAVGSGRTAGPSGGMVAVVIALAGIGVGKYAAFYLAVDQEVNKHTSRGVDSDHLISQIADELANERETAGKKINWPNQKPLEERTRESDYPPDLWQAARKIWDDFGSERQAEVTAEQQRLYEERVASLKAKIRAEQFPKTISPFMILWVVLAGVSAFKIGSSD